MSLMRLPKSCAYSWKMSFDGHVLWNRILIGPWALTTVGATTAALAIAAPGQEFTATPSRSLLCACSFCYPPWVFFGCSDY